MRWRAVQSRFLTGVITSPTIKRARRALYAARHGITGSPREVEYYHQVDDPYAHLCAQLLGPLCDRHQITLVPRVVSPPPAWATPDRERWVEFSRLDAARLAKAYNLDFSPPETTGDLDPLHVELAQRTLASIREPQRFAALAIQVGEALFAGDLATLESLSVSEGALAPSETRFLLEENAKRRDKLGHYLGAMFYYDGEWYWALDRLHHLEDRLILEGASSAAAPLIQPREPGDLRGADISQAKGRTLEYFVSMRSPYSYISLARTFAMARELEVDLKIRPLLPMVMRGLEVPMTKKIYIVRDARREAIRLNIPFGRVSDPMGGGIERVLSLVPYAREQGKLEDFLLSAGAGIFADELDVGEDKGLEAVVARVGLDWTSAKRWLAKDDWREEVAINREAMLEAGSWGVPSFRIDGEHTFWGQDRIWMVEQCLLGQDVDGASSSATPSRHTSHGFEEE